MVLESDGAAIELVSLRYYFASLYVAGLICIGNTYFLVL